MPAARLSSREGTLDIKVEIQKRLGRMKADKYFNLLTRLFSSRISKVEFDKHCITIIGKENVHLHNYLIRSILENACLGKVSLSPERRTKSYFGDKLVNGYQRSCLHSLGKCFPQNGRTPISSARRSKDHPSPLGPKGMSIDTVSEDIVSVVAEQEGNKDLHCIDSRTPRRAGNSQKEVEETCEVPSAVLSPIEAPLGIPQYAKQNNGLLLNGMFDSVVNWTCYSNGELPDTNSLMNRLEQKLESEGLNITADCANLLNQALDAHLKRLIKPCLELAGSKHSSNLIDQRKSNASTGLNGMTRRYLLKPNGNVLATYSDFRVAMELNPTILGTDWPLELEKVGLRASEDLN